MPCTMQGCAISYLQYGNLSLLCGNGDQAHGKGGASRHGVICAQSLLGEAKEVLSRLVLSGGGDPPP